MPHQVVQQAAPSPSQPSTDAFNFAAPSSGRPSSMSKYRKSTKAVPITWIVCGCIVGLILLCGVIGMLVDSKPKDTAKASSERQDRFVAELEEETKKLRHELPKDKHILIGKWATLGDRELGGSITIVEDSYETTLTWKFDRDGSEMTTTVVEMDSVEGVKLVYYPETDNGDYVLITPRGDLEVRDNQGVVLRAFKGLEPKDNHAKHPSIQQEATTKEWGFDLDDGEQAASDTVGTRQIIGRWSEKLSKTTNRITIYKTKGRLFIDQAFSDGSTLKNEVAEVPSTKGTRYDNLTDKRFGGYFVIDGHGDLQLWDQGGLFSTAKPVKRTKVQPEIQPKETPDVESAIDAIARLSGTCQRDSTGNIAKINLQATSVKDTDLAVLRTLAGLKTLNLKKCQNLTNDGLQHLSELGNLTGLDISYTHISDAGLEQLNGLQNLEVLSLWETDVTSSGLRHLSQLSRLRKLYLPRSKSQVTDASVGKLQQKLPNCNIYR